MQSAIAFSASEVAAEPCSPAVECVLHGNPQAQAWNHYTDATGQFNAGVWQGEAGAWRVRYAQHEDEFCVLIQGEVVLTPLHGAPQHFHAGEAFVVPGGFEGIWENLGRVRKHYAIMVASSPLSGALPVGADATIAAEN